MKKFSSFDTTNRPGNRIRIIISYDIIKAHGGELKVETKEGEGAKFIVQLPINT